MTPALNSQRMPIQEFPNETLLDILERLSLSTLISAHQVDRRWRQLCATVEDRLWTVYLSTPKDFPSADALSSPDQHITQAVRRSYVDAVERRHNIIIPEPYRAYLMEWPSKYPPPVLGPWPHAVRFFATGFCSCKIESCPEGCFCKDSEVRESTVVVPTSLLEKIRRRLPFAYEDTDDDPEVKWELFNNGPRLHGEARAELTKRYILVHPPEMWKDKGYWSRCSIRTLRLSRYDVAERMENGEAHWYTGEFRIHLEGPSRGEIHGWSGSSWYDGFEAVDFLDFKYQEWEPLLEDDPFPSMN